MIERINLLPEELKRAEKKRKIKKVFIFFVVVYLGGLGLLYFNQRFLIMDKEKVVNSLAKEKNAFLLENVEYRKTVEKINLTKNKEREMEERIEVIDSLIRLRIYWSEILRRITLLIPEDVWLISLTSYDLPKAQTKFKKGVKVAGTAFSNSKIAQFIFAIENLSLFDNVFLTYSRKREYLGRDLFDFELTAEIKGQGL